MRQLIDATGTRIRLAASPRRVISLVPSTTETVFALEAQDRLVGITRYCVRPPAARRSIPSVGGTKSPRIDRIRELEPDLILANREENREQDVAVLRGFAPVYVTFPQDVTTAIRGIETLATLLDCDARGGAMAATLTRSLEEVRSWSSDRPRFRYVYLIWRNPYMAVGPDTFIDAFLSEGGGMNAVPAGMGRYPKIQARDIENGRPDVIFMSSEPYPFTEGHAEELLDRMRDRPRWVGRLLLVDGQLLSWHGARMLEGIPYLRRLVSRIDELA